MAYRAAVACLTAALLGACVSSQDAKNGSLRFINAVPDSARMRLSVDGQLRASGFDYTNASSFLALVAGEYLVKIEESLPDPDPDDDLDNIYTVLPEESLDLDVNREWTYVIAGTHGDEDILRIENPTSGVATGKSRVQFVHAAVGTPAVDIYITREPADEDEEPQPEDPTQLAGGLAYLAVTEPEEITGGRVSIQLRTAGAPITSDAQLDTGRFTLTLESRITFVVAPNNGPDAATRPYILILATGGGSTVLVEEDTATNYRLVNASPSSDLLDVFLNDPSVDNDERQVCPIPVDPDDGFIDSFCNLPYEFIGDFNAELAATYEFKVQNATVTDRVAQTFGGSTLGRGVETTLVFYGLPEPPDPEDPDAVLDTDLRLATVPGTRRVAPLVQLRILTLSQGLEDAIEGDPTTDRIDIFLTEEPDDPLDEDAAVRLTTRRLGSDSGYISILPGTYRLTVAESDTAITGNVPVPIYTADVTLAGGGIYTLAFADTIPGTLPLRVLSLEDDAGLTPVP